MSLLLVLSLGMTLLAGCGAASPHSAAQSSPTATVNLTPTVQVIGTAQFPRYGNTIATPDIPGTNETIYEKYWQQQNPAYLKTLASFLTYTDAYGNEVKGGFMGLQYQCNSCNPNQIPTRDMTVANFAYFFGPLLATELVDDNLYVEIGLMNSGGTAIHDGSGTPLTQTFYVVPFRSNREPPIGLAIGSESNLSGAGGGSSIQLNDTNADLFAEYVNEYLLGSMVVIDAWINVVSGAPKGFDTSYWDEHRTAAYDAIKGYFLMQQGVKYANLPSQSRQYIGLKPHPGIDPGLFMTGPNIITFGDLPDPGFPNS